MRFIVCPHASNAYDQRMVSGLARGLVQAGQEAIGLTSPIPGDRLSAICKDMSIDAVFSINRLRPAELPLSVRHIGWFQDPLLPQSPQDHFVDGDNLYFIVRHPDLTAPAQAAGLPIGFLPMAVDDRFFSLAHRENGFDNDFGIAAYIPSPLAWNDEQRSIYERVRNHYKPLTGSLDIRKLSERIGVDACIKENFDHILECARMIDRYLLIRKATQVSHSIALYGGLWSDFDEFKPFYRGWISEPQDLAKLYGRTRLSLANNTNGLGIHSRTLECFASGGCLMMHKSENDNQSGTITTEFAPNEHYVEYTVDDFENVASHWLKKDRARLRIGEKASKVTWQKHLWRHRADRVIRDMALA